jgi:hypothetical protein
VYAEAKKLTPLIGFYFIVIALDTVTFIIAVSLTLSRLLATIFIIGGASTLLLIWIVSDHVDLTVILAILTIGHFLSTIVAAFFCIKGYRKHFCS